jgi:hypothetical protein
MSSTAPIDGVTTGTKRHPRLFLAVFAVFLIATTICVVGACLGILQSRLGNHDTRWFWASGHLLVHGANPYDQNAVGQMQTAVGIRVTGNDVVRNPPSALFLVVPLGLLGPKEGVIALSLLLAASFILAVLAMRATLDQPFDHRYLLLAWCFAPALCCIEVGQTGVVLLLGLTLFLRFHESHLFWAGAALSLCAFKPHLFLPFGVVLLVWIIARKRWAILGGAVVALVVESAITMLFDPRVWIHYQAAMRTQGFADLVVPTLGVMLRFLIDRTAMWLEFIPAILGSVWAIWYYFRNREHWDWRTQGSLLTLVSLVVAPYSWFTDQAIALPAILFALTGARRPRRGSLTLLLAVMSAGAIEMTMSSSLYFRPYMWQGVAWLAWYVYATSGTAQPDNAGAVAEEEG